MKDQNEGEMLKSRAEAFSRIPADQRFTWKITPQPGRLLFADTVGKSLLAVKDIFQSVGETLGQEHTVGVLDARIEEDGSFAVEIVVLPVTAERGEQKHG